MHSLCGFDGADISSRGPPDGCVYISAVCCSASSFLQSLKRDDCDTLLDSYLISYAYLPIFEQTEGVYFAPCKSSRGGGTSSGTSWTLDSIHTHNDKHTNLSLK